MIEKRPELTKKDYQFEREEYYLKDFYEKVSTNTNLDLTLFLRNLKNLSIVTNKEFNIMGNQAAYIPVFNMISYKKNLDASIMHELFHTSSTYVSTSKVYCGFSQMEIVTCEEIGRGLNEGYTALLDDRYFIDYEPSKLKNNKRIYFFCKLIAGRLEDLVGRDEMELMYSTSDLYSLFDALKELSSEEEVYHFFNNIDNLLKYNDDAIIPDVKKTFENYYEANHFLIKCFMALFIKNYNAGLISKEDYIEGLKLVKTELTKPIKLKRLKVIKSKQYTQEDFKKDLNEIKRKYQK